MAGSAGVGAGGAGYRAINNSKRRSHALAGCCRIPLFPESGYFQRSSSSLLAGELLNSSSALFPLYHVCVFLLSYLASSFHPAGSAEAESSGPPCIAPCTLLCSLLLRGRRKKVWRWTCPTDPPSPSIRSVPTSEAASVCLGEMCGWEEKSCFLPKAPFKGGQLRAGSVPGLNCSSSCGTWDMFESRRLAGGEGGAGLKADLGRNWATRVVWTRSMFMKGDKPWLPVGSWSRVSCFPLFWKEQSDLTNDSLRTLVLHQGGEGWEKGNCFFYPLICSAVGNKHL